MIGENKLNFLKNKKIAFLGLGEENFSLLKFLIKNKIKCELSVCDKRSREELANRLRFLGKAGLDFVSGKDYDKKLKKFDIIFRSPGYPLFGKNLKKAKKAGAIITSPMKLFFELCPTKNIIGVTGSKGKGTTASLIYTIFKIANSPATPKTPSFSPPCKGGDSSGGRGVFLGGNIGIAPFDFLEKIRPGDFVVLELSSFQLEDLDKSPPVAVITNLFREHLAPADPNNPNYHKSFAKYWQAKKNIFKHQAPGDFIVANKKLGKKIGVGKGIIFYSKSTLKSRLVGEHNRENIAAVAAVADIFGIKKSAVEKAVKNFRGLRHRIEKVAEKNGVKYYDDSFATAPDASIIALKAIGDNFPSARGGIKGGGRSREKKNIILFAGGADKGSDFREFAREIKKRVKYLVLFKGKGTDRIKKEIGNLKLEIRSSIVDNMKDAVRIAGRKARPGDIILLSAGCASFGCFKNYKDRGEQFKQEVKK